MKKIISVSLFTLGTLALNTLAQAEVKFARLVPSVGLPVYHNDRYELSKLEGGFVLKLTTEDRPSINLVSTSVYLSPEENDCGRITPATCVTNYLWDAGSLNVQVLDASEKNVLASETKPLLMTSSITEVAPENGVCEAAILTEGREMTINAAIQGWPALQFTGPKSEILTTVNLQPSLQMKWASDAAKIEVTGNFNSVRLYSEAKDGSVSTRGESKLLSSEEFHAPAPIAEPYDPDRH